RNRGRPVSRRPVAFAGYPRAGERTQLVPNRVVRLYVARTTSEGKHPQRIPFGRKNCRRVEISGTAKEIGMTVVATPAHGRIREVVAYFLRLALVRFCRPV